MRLLLLTIFTVTFTTAFSQRDTIEVSYDQTVILLFPSAIAFDDLGLGYSSTQMGNRYMLTVNPNELSPDGNVPQSSLYIELEDGSYFTFLLQYENNPSKTTYKLDRKDASGINSYAVKQEKKEENKKEEQEQSVAKLAEASRQILNRSDNFIHAGCYDRHTKIGMSIRAIYLFDGKLYFVLDLQNKGSMPYNIDFVKFSIVNKKKLSNKSAQQEDYLYPDYVKNGDMVIQPGIKTQHVYVFEKFNISSKKKLQIEMSEEKGEIVTKFKINQTELIKAETL